MSTAQIANKALASAALGGLLACSLVPSPATAQPTLADDFYAPGDFQGRVRSVVVDRHGVPWIATTQSLFKVSHGMANNVENVGGPDSRLTLMPGGDLYASLAALKSGRFGVQLRNLNNPGQVIANLGAPTVARGFTTLHAGFRGAVIVTATPLQYAEGLRGVFQYAFWSSHGILLGSAKLDGPQTGVVDEAGEAILLLGQSEAIAFDNRGNELWRVSGSYRKGVLAGRGSLAILNPSAAINEIHVVRSGAVTVVTLPGPVHELAATPDGSLAAIATDRGGVSFITTGSCSAASCPVQSMPALPFGGTYYISAIKFIDRATIALGIIEASGSPPNESFDRGYVVVAGTDGQVQFRHAMRLAPLAGWSPLLDVTFGERVFSAYTHDAVFVVEVN